MISKNNLKLSLLSQSSILTSLNFLRHFENLYKDGWSPEETARREELINTVFKDETRRDLAFVLSLIKNPLFDHTQVHILVPTTVFFKNGRPYQLVQNHIKGSQKGTLFWERNKHKIKIPQIRKIFEESHQRVCLKPFEPVRAKDRISLVMKDNIRKFSMLTKMETTDIREFLYSLGGKATQNLERYLQKFISPDNANWNELCKVMVRQKREFSTVEVKESHEAVRKRRFLSHPTTVHHVNENHLQFLNYKQFNRVVQQSHTNAYWWMVVYFQKPIYTLNNDYLYHRLKFDVNNIKNAELFRRASLESQCIIQYCPPSADDYVSPKEEKKFCMNLMMKHPSKWMLYVVYKVYHTANFFSLIKLTKFLAEFTEDSFGNVYLINLKIYDLESQHQNIHRAYAIERRRFKVLRRRNFMEDELENGEGNNAQRLQQGVLVIGRQSKNPKTGTERIIDQISRNVKPAHNATNSSAESLETQQKIQEAILKSFQEFVLKDFKKMPETNHLKFVKLMKEIDLVFKLQYPGQDFKLSEKLMQEDDLYKKFKKWFKMHQLNEGLFNLGSDIPAPSKDFNTSVEQKRLRRFLKTQFNKIEAIFDDHKDKQEQKRRAAELRMVPHMTDRMKVLVNQRVRFDYHKKQSEKLRKTLSEFSTTIRDPKSSTSYRPKSILNTSIESRRDRARNGKPGFGGSFELRRSKNSILGDDGEGVKGVFKLGNLNFMRQFGGSNEEEPLVRKKVHNPKEFKIRPRTANNLPIEDPHKQESSRNKKRGFQLITDPNAVFKTTAEKRYNRFLKKEQMREMMSTSLRKKKKKTQSRISARPISHQYAQRRLKIDGYNPCNVFAPNLNRTQYKSSERKKKIFLQKIKDIASKKGRNRHARLAANSFTSSVNKDLPFKRNMGFSVRNSLDDFRGAEMSPDRNKTLTQNEQAKKWSPKKRKEFSIARLMDFDRTMLASASNEDSGLLSNLELGNITINT